jgi:hypothetical protein
VNCRTHFRDGQVKSVDRGEVEVQKRRRSGKLGRKMIRVGMIWLSELVLWFSVRGDKDGEEDGENGEVEGEEELGGS